MNVGGAGDILDDGASGLYVCDEMNVARVASFGEVDFVADPGDIAAGRITRFGVVRRIEPFT